ncbi:MAG: polymer-forming cytoskeletal protein [Acidobacteriota bacterium]
MIFKSDETPGGDLNGFLDAGSHIRGELNFENTFRVDGKITGNVKSKGDLVVGDGGVIDGEIEAGRIFVSGTVKGEVKALQRVEIGASGRVEADVWTPALVIEDGAFFQGRCTMEVDTPSETSSRGAKVAPLKSPQRSS